MDEVSAIAAAMMAMSPFKNRTSSLFILSKVLYQPVKTVWSVLLKIFFINKNKIKMKLLL